MMRPNFAIRGVVAALSAGSLVSLFVVAGCNQAARSEVRAAAVPTVTVVKVERRTVPLEAEINGVTRAMESVTLRARVKGFLQETPLRPKQEPAAGPGEHVTAREGSVVKGPQVVADKPVPGDLLFVIEEAPYKAALDAAKANLEAAKADLLKSEKSKIRETSSTQVNLDRAKNELAKAEEKRRLILYQRQVTAKEELDEYQARRVVSDQQVKSSEAQLEQATSDFETTIAAARANVLKADAEVENAQLQLNYCRVYTPIGGRLGETKVKVGNLVGPMTSTSQDTDLATIEKLDPMGVEFRPTSKSLARSTYLLEHGGIAVRLLVRGNQAYPHEGWTYFVDNTVDPTTSTYLIKASVPNPGSSLLPGEYVRVKAIVGEYHDALVVPAQAVIDGGQIGSYVYIIEQLSTADSAKGGTEARAPRIVARRVLVEVLDEYRGLKVLRKGVEPGQLVVVEGLQLIARPGQPVDYEEQPLDQVVRLPEESAASTEEDLVREGLIRFPGASGTTGSAPSSGGRPNVPPAGNEPAATRVNP